MIVVSSFTSILALTSLRVLNGQLPVACPRVESSWERFCELTNMAVNYVAIGSTIHLIQWTLLGILVWILYELLYNDLTSSSATAMTLNGFRESSPNSRVIL